MIKKIKIKIKACKVWENINIYALLFLIEFSFHKNKSNTFKDHFDKIVFKMLTFINKLLILYFVSVCGCSSCSDRHHRLPNGHPGTAVCAR